MKVSIADYGLPKSGAAVVGVLKGGKLLPGAQALDKATGGALARAVKAGRFDGARGQWLELLAPSGVELDRILLAGLGEAKALDDLAFEAVGGEAVQRLARTGAKTATLVADAIAGCPLAVEEAAAHMGLGALLGSYRFGKYRTREKSADKPSLTGVSIAVKGAAKARRLYKMLEAVAAGVFLTRDVVSEPANVIYPESLAAEC
ncbi:MAG TPA: M17 family peptidase N-terminal domain-containing protein, partial [Alphaproteobacteria bacterium]|nr:M17 family peptidase N-terminal domain-containing protein [Alphaproteobacteria bacterium]